MKFSPVTLIDRYFHWLLWIGAVLLIALFPVMAYLIVHSPDDYLQDNLVRIMYIHVPAAWLGVVIYSVICLSSVIFIVFRNPQFQTLARLLAPIGICYTVIALTTGSIWGKPAWGTWWVWDARLTSMLLLLCIYIGYHSLSNHDSTSQRTAVVSSYYAIASFIIIPIIKFSVDLWSTLHQPSSILKLNGPTIHSSILLILIIALIFHILFACVALILSVRIEMVIRKRKRRVLYENQN